MADKETALVLRVTKCDGTSYGGFQWPLEAGAEVVAPDWKANEECGNGLHGWLYGNGDYSAGGIQDDSQWMVVEVVLADVVMLGGKVKFPRCALRFVGDRKSATDYLIANEPRANGVIGASVTVGDDQCAQVGAFGFATAGDRGTATAGYSGTATAGDRGTATAGYSGTATAGYSGTATAGDRGTATAGYSGTATAGYSGEIHIRYYDRANDRMRTRVGYIGEHGLKANTPYRLNDKNEFEEVK
jgi:hypothetical protein